MDELALGMIQVKTTGRALARASMKSCDGMVGFLAQHLYLSLFIQWSVSWGGILTKMIDFGFGSVFSDNFIVNCPYYREFFYIFMGVQFYWRGV